MGSIKIAIVCDSKEISYGLNLFHLFYYKNEKEKFVSGKYDEVSIEMYSTAVFRHTNISKKTIKLFVGVAQNVDTSYKKIFDKFGMTIYQTENNYILKADDKQLKEYNDFIAYANAKKNKYFELEKDYSMRVSEMDPNWIVSEFIQSTSKGVFRIKNTRVQQQYDCLAFVVYLEILKNTKE